MMKRTLTILLAFALSNVYIMAGKELSAREILDRTTKRMRTSGGISAKFVTTLHNGTIPQETITGNIDISGNKYVMQTSAISTWFNGKDQWTLVTANEEVTLVSPTPEELQASSPIAFMDIYKQGFNLSSRKSVLRGRKTWDVTLKPKKSITGPSEIIVSIDQETFLPMCIRIKNQGDWTCISITDMQSGTGLDDSHFSYPADRYSSYEIIDMR